MKYGIIVICLIVSITCSLRCPKDVRSDWVKENFTLKDLADGEMTYELAYKDITQPRVLKCITGRKTLLDNSTILYDDFRVQVLDTVIPSNLTFYTVDELGNPLERGVMNGKWNYGILKYLNFPNQIVDVGYEKKENGTYHYKWIVEFQCIEVFGYVAFYAFNFYSKTNTMENYQAMYDTAVKHGLQPFIDELPNKIKIVDHTDCWYQKNSTTTFDSLPSFLQ